MVYVVKINLLVDGWRDKHFIVAKFSQAFVGVGFIRNFDTPTIAQARSDDIIILYTCHYLKWRYKMGKKVQGGGDEK